MGLAAFITASSFVLAASSRDEATVASIESNTGGEPIMAIISLSSQRIAVYDSHGLILRAPVSSGQRGRETPAGIFSVIEKEAEHYSNLYDDAYMPNMMRLTWSGIALHGGRLPGHPASHGCIRLPYDFAERLFDATKVGMRVIVAPTDVAPVPIMHPLLFPSKTDKAVIAAARAAEADSAARKADEAETRRRGRLSGSCADYGVGACGAEFETECGSSAGDGPTCCRLRSVGRSQGAGRGC